MLVDKTNLGLVLYNHDNFYRFDELSSYWLVKTNISFSVFFIGQPGHTSGITVYNRTVTYIENCAGRA